MQLLLSLYPRFSNCIQFPFNFPSQENMEREMAEVKRKQKERLQSAAKRRSTATCSLRDRDVEGIALESVLQRFLKPPGSLRRARTPSPTSANLDENSLPKKQPNKYSTKENWSLNTSQSSLNKENSEERKPEKKGLLWRKSGERASLAGEDEEVLTEKEVQKMREVSQKVLLYQSSRGSASSGEYLSPVTSPRRRTFQEDGEKLMSVTSGEDVTKPLKSPLLLLPNSPSALSRRHTIALPAADLLRPEADEDRFVPGEPENESPGNPTPTLGNIGRIKSVDSYLPSANDSGGNSVPSSTPTGKSEITGEAEVRQETADSQQNTSVNGQNNHAKKTSRLMSFFKRLSEMSKTNSREPDSSSVDP